MQLDSKVAEEARIVVPSQLIGVREAAELLGMGRSGLTRRIAAGKGPRPLARLEGGTLIFDRADVLAEVHP